MSSENAAPDAERAAFEAWCDERGFDRSLWIPGGPQCGYANTRLMDYWEGWHARAALAAQAAAPGWIVAAEQQAPAHTEVLVALSNGAVTTGELVGRLGWHWEPTDDEPEGVWVRHWMRKPAAPAG